MLCPLVLIASLYLGWRGYRWSEKFSAELDGAFGVKRKE